MNTGNKGRQIAQMPKAETEFPIISIKQYRGLKYRLKKLEAENFNRVIAIPCNGQQNWYEIAEHSALFYYYEVCQKLGLKTKFFADTMSFYDPYEIGYIRSKGVENIRNNLIELNLYVSEHREDEAYVFVLKTHYPEDKLDALIEKEKARRLKNLAPAPANNLDPELHQLIVNSSIRLHRICNSRLDRLSSQTNGADIIRLIDKLLENYHVITMFSKSQTTKLKTYLEKMRHDIYHLIIKVKILGETKLWDFELCSSVSEPLYQIRDRIDNHLNQIIKKERQRCKNGISQPPADN